MSFVEAVDLDVPAMSVEATDDETAAVYSKKKHPKMTPDFAAVA